jgi:hypothetical protein
MKMELPELDNLYYIILQWDYFSELVDDELVTNKIEDDIVYEEVHQSTELEKVPIKFQNTEDYFRIFHSLFLTETRAQISRSKQMEVLCINLARNFGKIFFNLCKK